MYLEAKETARIYKLLTEKLGSDTTEAMFKYIDNKTERSVEATIKTLATKDDISDVRKDFASLRKEMGDNFVNFHKQIGENTANIYKEIAEKQENNVKWMFVFWIGQFGATMAILLMLLKK
jgi:hypothetical protein